MSKLNRGLPIIIYDFETTGKNPYTCQVTQIAAIVIDGMSLTPKDGGIFNTEVCPIFDDDKAIAAGYGPVEQEALNITRKTREGLEGAPDIKIAWKNFRDFCKRFSRGSDSYNAPISAGYNINGYDAIIVKRLCDKYGPVDKNGRPSIFNALFKYDVMDMVYSWLEFSDSSELSGISLVKVCEFLGIPSEHTDLAHDALVDVKNTANILIRFLKYQRELSRNTKFKNSFENGVFYV
jgi:DNA polymerase III epsilon subunit-like protein